MSSELYAGCATFPHAASIRPGRELHSPAVCVWATCVLLQDIKQCEATEVEDIPMLATELEKEALSIATD